MKWGKLKDYKYGTTRVVRVFLWFPVKIQGQARWLEYAHIKQWTDAYATKWENIEWADDERVTEPNHYRSFFELYK